MRNQQHYFNAKPTANPNYNPNLNPILMASPTNPSLAADGTTFYTVCLHCATDAVISRGDLSVCVSVCRSVLFHIPVFCPDELRYDHAVYTSRYNNHSSFISGEVKFIPIFAGDHHQRGR